MNVDLIFKIAAIGILVAVLNQVLSRSGRDEQATLVSLSGMVVILILIAERVGHLVGTLRSVFGL